jgi:type IX secretion system PorP/SprF family membrane protein
MTNKKADMNKQTLITILIILQVSLTVKAQDPVFSQPYMAPVYLNPAATGSGDYDLRISGIMRRQWWSIPSRFTYTAFSIDKYLPSLQSGIGLMVTSSSEGYLKKNGIYASYAYTFCPGAPPVASNSEMPKWFLTGAMQAGWVQRRVDYSDLLFADQIDINGPIPGSQTQADLPVYSGRWYPDISTGMFFNYRFSDFSRILVGVSARHINRPDESLTATNDKARSILPVLWSGNFLYTNSKNEHWTYSIAGNGSKQQNNQFLQLGVEVTQNDLDIGIGAWYRGSATLKEPDAFTLTLSFNLSGRNNASSKIRVGIAHDSPIGDKKYSNNGGSSEFGFVWDQSTYNADGDNPCKPAISPRMACPGSTR